MARRTMVEVTCDRCKKTYEAPPPPSTSARDDLLTLSSPQGIFIDATDLELGQIVYDDLCPRCRKRVTSLISEIKRFQDNDEAEAHPPAVDVRHESTPPAPNGGRFQPGDGGTTMKDQRFAARPDDDEDDHERDDEDGKEEGEEDEHDE